MRRGDIVELGQHRLMCGDATNAADVADVMDGEKAVLLHADPPYGMNKKGVTNDNLHGEKLDTFQMTWWQACRPHLADNAGAYIWGKAEDLWRLWFCGGLRDSERLTFRNEIVWAKGSAGAAGISHKGAEGLRLYPQETERCLFFMLGEQGFNNNADNYWEGWEPIRSYLDGERQKMGWDIPTVKRIVGHSDLSRDHWFSRSQWSFPTEKVYRALQQAAAGRAFRRDFDALRRDFDALRRDFYATRACFDNTHDLMTDTWSFPRVVGRERHGHETPKPVSMLERICKTSAPQGGLILDPMAGSGSMLIAAENTGRRCVAIEIDAHYCQVIIDRWEKLTGQRAIVSEEEIAA